MSTVIDALAQAVRCGAGTIIAVPLFVWSLVTWPFRKFSRLSNQWKVFIAVGIMVGVLTIGGLQIKSQVRTSVHWQYWTQVLTGNWSPQQPQQRTELPDLPEDSNYITDREYLYGVVAAVVVNLGAIAFLIKILLDVIKIKRRNTMDVEQAVAFRDSVITLLFTNALEKCEEQKIPISKDTAERLLEAAREKVGHGIEGSKYFRMALTTEEYDMLQKKIKESSPNP